MNIFKRIQNYFAEKRMTKKINQTLAALPMPTAPTHQIYRNTSMSNALTFTGDDGEDIFSIASNGAATWYKEDSYSEAANMFLTYLTMNIEDTAAIKQNRIEWEERMLEAMKKHAETEPLTPENLTEVFGKCIMLDKLKGIK